MPAPILCFCSRVAAAHAGHRQHQGDHQQHRPPRHKVQPQARQLRRAGRDQPSHPGAGPDPDGFGLQAAEGRRVDGGQVAADVVQADRHAVEVVTLQWKSVNKFSFHSLTCFRIMEKNNKKDYQNLYKEV